MTLALITATMLPACSDKPAAVITYPTHAQLQAMSADELNTRMADCKKPSEEPEALRAAYCADVLSVRQMGGWAQRGARTTWHGY
jgi:hypothetical protein